ncbi:hypothetical protein FJT64_023260 [Amphibalanus amphitrite]|uniref:Uncharacterized protein n=1 Tax=Amphibalanus amphitrite TaxID=1232801 RepID=A0A6A4WSC2_AMPAM|nr:hypothetical protein FJT64_023260 [Amphibalanus amphitrite]
MSRTSRVFKLFGGVSGQPSGWSTKSFRKVDTKTTKPVSKLGKKTTKSVIKSDKKVVEVARTSATKITAQSQVEVQRYPEDARCCHPAVARLAPAIGGGQLSDLAHLSLPNNHQVLPVPMQGRAGGHGLTVLSAVSIELAQQRSQLQKDVISRCGGGKADVCDLHPVLEAQGDAAKSIEWLKTDQENVKTALSEVRSVVLSGQASIAQDVTGLQSSQEELKDAVADDQDDAHERPGDHQQRPNRASCRTGKSREGYYSWPE